MRRVPAATGRAAGRRTRHPAPPGRGTHLPAEVPLLGSGPARRVRLPTRRVPGPGRAGMRPGPGISLRPAGTPPVPCNPMAEHYDAPAIEAKWQRRWEEEGAYQVDNDDSRPP